jgi:hypothetical protein
MRRHAHGVPHSKHVHVSHGCCTGFVVIWCRHSADPSKGHALRFTEGQPERERNVEAAFEMWLGNPAISTRSRVICQPNCYQRERLPSRKLGRHVKAVKSWLRRLDLNQRPLGYENAISHLSAFESITPKVSLNGRNRVLSA